MPIKILQFTLSNVEICEFQYILGRLYIDL